MRALILGLLFAACHAPPPAFVTSEGARAEPGRLYRWSFDERGGEGAPRRTFVDVLGRWEIAPDPEAASPPNVMREVRAYAADAEPRVVVGDLVFTDVTVRVRCRTDAPHGICGVMVAFADSDDYIAIRADGTALRIEQIARGARRELASVAQPLSTGAWHLLEIHLGPDGARASCDGGAPVTAVVESVQGNIGLLTDGAAAVSFDDLEALAERPR